MLFPLVPRLSSTTKSPAYELVAPASKMPILPKVLELSVVLNLILGKVLFPCPAPPTVNTS